MLRNNPWVKEETKREMKKYLETKMEIRHTEICGMQQKQF